jgi:hypothetical protein
LTNEVPSLSLADWNNIQDALKYWTGPVSEFAATPDEEWDANTQATLDEYWPNTTDLNCIKRIPGKAVYTAQYEGNEVIVKSITYDQSMYDNDVHYMQFLNFMGEKV